MPVEDLLFVYGTLRSGSSHAARRFMERHCKYIGEAEAPGRLYDIGGFPGLILMPDSICKVKGEIYQMQESEVLLTYLDRYEGCSGLRPYFQRKAHQVFHKNGSAVAWMYLYSRPVDGYLEIESGDYSKYLHEQDDSHI